MGHLWVWRPKGALHCGQVVMDCGSSGLGIGLSIFSISSGMINSEVGSSESSISDAGWGWSSGTRLGVEQRGHLTRFPA